MNSSFIFSFEYAIGSYILMKGFVFSLYYYYLFTSLYFFLSIYLRTYLPITVLVIK